MKSERGIGIIAFIFLILFLIGFIALSIYLIKLDNVIRDKFEGNRWDIPAKVFARPLEIYNNAPVAQKDLVQELNMLGYKNSGNYEKTGNYVLDNNTIFIHTRGFDYGDRVEPEQVLKVTFANDIISDVQATKPSGSGIAYLEPMVVGGIYPQHNEDRVLIKLKNVPKPLIEALIATEDRNFYHHKGISFRGTARAIVSNITGGKRQGGSTLTQQLIKNFFLTPEKTIKRKANEAFMALLLEMHYDKDEILEAYLNEVNLGQSGNFSINGYGLAAQYYFGLPLRELNISQQAFLVGLVQGPTLYNPWKNPEGAIKRRNTVLNNMVVMGYLSPEQYETESHRPLNVVEKPSLNTARFPDFLDIVRRQLKADYQEADLTHQGLRIFTSLDPIAQTKVESTFKSSVQNLVKGNPKQLKTLQGAVIVTQPDTGEIKAVVGSTQSFTGFNRSVDAKRQVGSLLKPLIYLSALESGRYTWASEIEDNPISIPVDGNKMWTPKNYSGTSYGYVPMVKALSNSYNLSAVRLGNEFGLSSFSNKLIQFGVTSKIPPVPAIYLGAVDLSPIEVSSIYTNFASGGTRHPIQSIRSVVDNNGQVLSRFSTNPINTIEPAAAFLINYGLQQVINAGTGRAAANSLGTELKLAGKSGTTNDTRDSWFAGYSGNNLTVVWLGLDDNKVTGLTGSSGALPVWINVMKQLRQKPVVINQTSQVQWHWIDPSSGYLSAQGCEGALYVPLMMSTVPNRATECAAAAYQTEEATLYDDPSSPEETDDSIGNYIRESENQMEEELSNGRVISSGSFHN